MMPTIRLAVLAAILAAGPLGAAAGGQPIAIEDGHGWERLQGPAPSAPRDPFDFDPDETDPNAQNGMNGFVLNQFEMNDAQINGWIFQDGQDAAGARKKLEEQLDTRIAGLADLCRLAPEQEAKLRLAGAGDLERFFEKVDALRREHTNKKYDQNQIGEVYQKFQPVSQEYQAGLFDDRSLLVRTARRTLAPDQAARYDAMMRERRDFQYRAKVGYVLDMLGRQLGLTDEQYAALEAMIIEEGAPVRSLGRVEYYAILYRLAQVPEDRLKAVLDQSQWDLIAMNLQQAKAMREMIAQQGYVEYDEEPKAKAEAPDTHPAEETR